MQKEAQQMEKQPQQIWSNKLRMFLISVLNIKSNVPFPLVKEIFLFNFLYKIPILMSTN
jgi:hypothetical protein